MSNIKVYRRKPILPVLVKAILWDGTDECYGDVKIMMDGKHIEKHSESNILFYAGKNKAFDTFAQIGEFIVYAMNEVTVWKAYEFLDTFELFTKEYEDGSN
jgi:hypothetical protein